MRRGIPINRDALLLFQHVRPIREMLRTDRQATIVSLTTNVSDAQQGGLGTRSYVRIRPPVDTRLSCGI